MRFPFTDGEVEFTVRPGYLHLVERGFCGSREGMGAYCDAISAMAEKEGKDAVLIDTRATHLPDPTNPRWKDIRELRWSRMAASKLRYAFVLNDEMSATRVSMTARGAGAEARGFTEVLAAVRWLTR